jgi:O-antigen ligase
VSNESTYSKVIGRIKIFFLLSGIFLLPFGFFVGPATGFLSLAWLAEGKWKLKWETFRQNSLLWPWVIFYGLYLLGLIWTSNSHEASISLQVKFGMFILPLIYSTVKMDIRQTQRALAIFISGLIAAGIFMLARSSYYYFSEGRITFYYQEFSKNLVHPSYLSMYYCTGIMVLFHGILLQSFSKKMKLIAVLLCLFFAVLVFLLSSKLGILSMMLLFAGYIVYSVFRFKRYIVGGAALFVLIAGSFIALKAFPEISGRINRMKEALLVSSNVDPSSVESNQVRLLVWQADLNVISRNLWTGVGTGDSKDSLKAEYKSRGMTGAYKEGLNAHSQLFQTTIALGIPGLIALLLLIFYPAAWALRKQFGFAVLFAGLFFLNIIPESMFEVQAGVLFFGIFYSLILFSAERNCLTPLKAPSIKF